MADERQPNPDTPSSDYEAMLPFWKMVSTILGGAKAMRKAGTEYLPQFPDEPDEKYKFRLAHAKFTNIYGDIVQNLAQRPFAKDVVIDNDTIPPEFDKFKEDVDSSGNSLHVFAGEVFFNGMNNAIDWILVDHPKGPEEELSVAAERALGLRPYWVRYPATSVLAAYSKMIEGEEQFIHVRLHEPVTERVGFGEVTKNRVRVFDRLPNGDGTYGPPIYEIFEEQEDSDGKGKKEWISIEGPFKISIDKIPLVPFITGRRVKKTWQFLPPMQDAAFLQVEHYQQESALKYAKEATAFPMLAGNGVEPETDEGGSPKKISVGPHSVLYAPPGQDGDHGEWVFIEPSAESLKFLAEDIRETGKELRELGRQPLTAQSGNLTVVTTAFAANKGNSAIQAWALNLKDALENCLAFTADWLKSDFEASVKVDTDFDLGWGAEDSFGHVMTLKNTGQISRNQTISEAKRRNIIATDYDAEADLEAIQADQMDDSGGGSLDDDE